MYTKKNSKILDIPLNKDALHHLKNIFIYTKIISDIVTKLNDSQLSAALKGGEGVSKDLPLQHSLIFCLKAMGGCLERAADAMELKMEDTPLFWRNLFYLRNSLVHHCPVISIPPQGLNLLSSICTKIGHIYKYFSMVVDEQNTAVDLKGERYKVFLDVHELAQGLKTTYSREKRQQISQGNYLNVISMAIDGINLLTNNIHLNERSMNEWQINDPKMFYALQNLLELISTLANPNPEYRILSEKTRQAIDQSHPDAHQWLKNLGDSRNEAMHQEEAVGVIENYDLPPIIKNMQLLKSEVLLNKDFQNRLRVNISIAKPKPLPSQSTSEMMQALSIQPTDQNININSEVNQQNTSSTQSFQWGRGRGNNTPQQINMEGSNTVPSSGRGLEKGK